MSDRETKITEHSPLAEKLQRDLTGFIDQFRERSAPTLLDDVANEETNLRGKPLHQEPERFTEDYLIRPVLKSLGHDVLPRPVKYVPKWKHDPGVPDFALTTIPIPEAKLNHLRLFVEAKKPNNIDEASRQIKKYLNRDWDYHAVAIATDGIYWELYLRHRKDAIKPAYSPYAEANLREPLRQIKVRNYQEIAYSPHQVRNTIEVKHFAEFTRKGMLDTVKQEFGIDYKTL